MKRPLKLPLHNYKRAKEVLEAEDQVEIDRSVTGRPASLPGWAAFVKGLRFIYVKPA